jgi:hypothetical protein
MKKAVSYFMIGAITSAAVIYMMNKYDVLENISNEKRRMVDKFKAML